MHVKNRSPFLHPANVWWAPPVPGPRAGPWGCHGERARVGPGPHRAGQETRQTQPGGAWRGPQRKAWGCERGAGGPRRSDPGPCPRDCSLPLGPCNLADLPLRTLGASELSVCFVIPAPPSAAPCAARRPLAEPPKRGPRLSPSRLSSSQPGKDARADEEPEARNGGASRRGGRCALRPRTLRRGPASAHRREGGRAPALWLATWAGHVAFLWEGRERWATRIERGPHGAGPECEPRPSRGTSCPGPAGMHTGVRTQARPRPRRLRGAGELTFAEGREGGAFGLRPPLILSGAASEPGGPPRRPRKRVRRGQKPHPAKDDAGAARA